MKEPPKLRYTATESAAAHAGWKASCGHHALAATCETTLNEVKAAVTNHKSWMNPTDIGKALAKLRVPYVLTNGMDWIELRPGINRIQFKGPWLDPDKPIHKTYWHTHWVALRNGWILDTVIDPNQWIQLGLWLDLANQYTTKAPKTGWHVTHWYEIQEPAGTIHKQEPLPFKLYAG